MKMDCSVINNRYDIFSINTYDYFLSSLFEQEFEFSENQEKLNNKFDILNNNTVKNKQKQIFSLK
jgi:hypothetical protein